MGLLVFVQFIARVGPRSTTIPNNPRPPRSTGAPRRMLSLFDEVISMEPEYVGAAAGPAHYGTTKNATPLASFLKLVRPRLPAVVRGWFADPLNFDLMKNFVSSPSSPYLGLRPEALGDQCGDTLFRSLVQEDGLVASILTAELPEDKVLPLLKTFQNLLEKFRNHKKEVGFAYFSSP